MAARIIFLGTDTCYRLPVLVSAGYYVENFQTIESLREATRSIARVDAIILTDLDCTEPEKTLALARANGSVPVILFRDHNWDCPFGDFDLIVPPLTLPRFWLDQVESLIRGNARPPGHRRIMCKSLSAREAGREQDLA